MSRMGKKPIPVPSNVKVNIADLKVHVDGPKGKLEYLMHHGFKAALKDSFITISRPTDSKQDMAFHGLARSMINNMIKGVADGFVKTLEVQGVGYRAQVQGKELVIQLGFSHPIKYHIPEGIVVETPKPTDIVIKGVDKQKVGQAAAEIRGFMKPEPYKGKGIRYTGEYVRKKAGKAVA